MNNIYEDIKINLIILVIFLILDLPMIGLINKNMYQSQFERINTNNKLGYERTIIAAIITYLLLVIGLYYFAIKQNSVYNGAIFGVVVYGIYNFTNLATITNYGIKESIIDTIWGTILCTLVTYIVLEINAKFLSRSELKMELDS